MSRTAASDGDERRPRRTYKAEAAAHLRSQILSGALPPGSRIDQDAVSDALGISKLPVREALIQLESEGLIVNVAHRGAFVGLTSPEDILDSFEVYGLASGLAASRAVDRITPEQLARLESICDQMDASHDMAELQELNRQFHRLVSQVGGSGRLRAILRYLTSSLPANFYEFAPHWRETANREHREIFEAIRDRDKERADHAMAQHTWHGGEHAVEVLKQRGFWASVETPT
ncbi:GntR family transcriptional regulator [Microbacterium sp. No. 7]|uniref:GntR family transcriptional regulator n=1 Tax=Microbacterium sp. No. 7 TaxID=1714373 RepID=UPI0006D1B69C|nr:GntR family transcriptional regulator [Microbacterium sp. No. 7]ALJ19289.1 hypothetical protein AOA12_04970 [Microbacterium sp. No. 7]